MNEDLEKLILKAYMRLLSKSTIIPSISDIIRTAKSISDEECMDIIYKFDFDKALENENDVHNVLAKYAHAHKFFSSICFDAQNNLFADWFEYQRLLGE